MPTGDAMGGGVGVGGARAGGASTGGAPLRPFTPQREQAAALSARTVGRDHLLRVLQAKVQSAATSAARPHVLLVGPPGVGKTHVVEVLLHRASADPSVRDRVLVVRAPHEGLGVTRYSDLLAEVQRTLDPGGSRGAGVPAPGEREARIRQLVGDRVVLLVIEHLDRVFDDLGTAGQRSLRAWVETTGQVMLLTTTPAVFPGIRERDQPWFGGLATFVLPGLSANEAQHLVANLAQSRGQRDLAGFVLSDSGRARIRALSELAGGSPRALVMLAEQGSSTALDELTPAVANVLEGLVPYHESLLWALSSNERRLVAALAAGTGSATVSELATSSELEQRTAASALGRMAAQHLVVSEKPDGGDRRTTYYRLRDPVLRQHVWYRTRGVDVVGLSAALLRAHQDPAVRQPLSEAAHQRLRAGDLDGALAAAAAGGGPDVPAARRAHEEADVILAAVSQVRRGRRLEMSRTSEPARRLVDCLLGAARGDATARAALIPEWRRLLEPAPTRGGA